MALLVGRCPQPQSLLGHDCLLRMPDLASACTISMCNISVFGTGGQCFGRHVYLQQELILKNVGLCAGDLKLTMPTAFTVSMLAWGALAFPTGYQKAHQMPQLLNTVRWGSDYLMKTWKPDTMSDRSVGYLIVYQARLLHPAAHPSIVQCFWRGITGKSQYCFFIEALPHEVHADPSRTPSVSKRGDTIMSAV